MNAVHLGLADCAGRARNWPSASAQVAPPVWSTTTRCRRGRGWARDWTSALVGGGNSDLVHLSCQVPARQRWARDLASASAGSGITGLVHLHHEVLARWDWPLASAVGGLVDLVQPHR
ncbi:hypothetical protein V1227_02355 [Lentzea sp. DG1S-22]|uniref:hypothetical protein n=1 Tax=Lentzea sp. DG1S-22 TaxID=3108822 RepID=UPI002E78DB19|nr:hypothetical protein [Lentzea sp. DG1S-22]WVH81620.1 hypothetical protein V1227_02355 [Lentzea sp. DG1S-22]